MNQGGMASQGDTRVQEGGKLRILAPTVSALKLAETIAGSAPFDVDIWQRPGSLTAEIKRGIEDQIPTLAICALGIISRTLADADLPSKAQTAPLICATENGEDFIPVLGGHRGANVLAKTLAHMCGGHAVITTASDQAFGLALDSPPPGWALHDPRGCFSKFMQFLLQDGVADLSAAPDWVRDSQISHQSPARLKISWRLSAAPDTGSGGTGRDDTGESDKSRGARANEGATTGKDARMRNGEVTSNEVTSDTHLVFITQGRLVVGLGCERHCPLSFIQDLIAQAEAILGTSLREAAYASIDLKSDEGAFTRLAPHMRFFPATQLAKISVPNPSAIVRAEVGTPSVAEASALALAGPSSDLILPKIKNPKATLAVALAPEPIDLMTTGTPRPTLSIIGLGPGAPDLVSPQARNALLAADTWVGYSLYMDQAAGILGEEKPRLDFNLGDEEARCRAALDAAAMGGRVALICSGDPQVYAMAQVVYELLARHDENEAWQRLNVETLPGITAMSALAAKVGAPMGHDFCAISLSDLNTPWEVIEKKVTAAAEADFVIGFYNPRSQKRDWQLPRALEILKAHRPADCPVAFGRNVSREDEAITRTTLGDVKAEDIDMFTCLIIGASFTQRHGDFIFTPRGYKLDGNQGKG